MERFKHDKTKYAIIHLFIGSKYIEYKLKYKNINLAQFYGAHNAHVVKDHTLCASAGNHELE